MIERRMTVFLILVVFWLVVGFSEHFIVRAPICRTDDYYHKTIWKQ